MKIWNQPRATRLKTRGILPSQFPASNTDKSVHSRADSSASAVCRPHARRALGEGWPTGSSKKASSSMGSQWRTGEWLPNTLQKSSPFPIWALSTEAPWHFWQSLTGWPRWHLCPCCLKPEFTSASFLPPLTGDQLPLVSYGRPTVWGAFLLEARLLELPFSIFVWLFEWGPNWAVKLLQGQDKISFGSALYWVFAVLTQEGSW